MKKSKIAGQINDHEWLVWIGYITSETEEERHIEYYGKFADTKKSAIGAAKVMIDNSRPYRIIIQDCKPFHGKHPDQTELGDFFTLEEED